MRGFDKKGALELSINAIVIVILAMTLLGLGLGFVRNMFKDIGGTTAQVQQQMREQITEQLRQGDKPLAFPTSEIGLSKKDTTNLAVGVRNTMQGQRDFTIRIYQVNEGTGKRQYTVADCNALSICEPSTNTQQGTYVYNKGSFKLGVNQDYIMPIKYTASTTTGTQVFEIVVFSQVDCTKLNQNDCVGACKWENENCKKNATNVEAYEEYATKSFFITIS
jgi:hypothetical protein